MFGKSFKPVRPGMPLFRQVGELQRAVTASRNQRPGSGYRAVTTPFGTAMMSAHTADWIAMTTSGGVAAATTSGTSTKLGTGTVNLGFPTYAADGTVSIDYNTDIPPLPVYNLSGQAVAGNAVVIISKLYGNLWVVTWEDCTG